LFSTLLCIGFAAVMPGCFYSTQTEIPVPPITVSGNAIQVRAGSKFLNQLQIAEVTLAPGGERKLRTVGQMVAIATHSGELTSGGVSWVTLDQGIIRSLGIHLSEYAPIGLAYGVTSIPPGNRSEIHPGEKAQVYRYGLRQNSTTASVLSVQSVPGSDAEISVIFTIPHGQDWYPGTNCQVEFPLIQHQPVALSPLSMLHEGLREYVLKEIAPGKYLPLEIVVINETRDQVFALGDLVPGDRVVDRGAILLKPVIHQYLEAARGAYHAR
jgi:hypothetical protein